jgi:4-amino-4-deoxy-L-arabinose transferase-like glycosyltransferase
LRPRAIAGFLIAAAYLALMAVISFKYHIIGDYGVETDFYNFVNIAREIQSGALPIDGERGPVYFLLLALVEGLTGNFFKAGMVLGLLSSAATLYFTFRLLALLTRTDLAFAATLVVAANAVFVQHTYSCGTDMLFMAISTGALYSLLRHRRIGYRHVFTPGLMAGAAYLTRYNGVFLIVGLAAGVFLLTGDKARLQRRLVACALFLAVCLAAIIPWGIHCADETGRFFYNTNYKNVAYAVYGEGEMDWDSFWGEEVQNFGSYSDVLQRDPVRFAGHILDNFYGNFTEDMGGLLGWHVGALVLPGLAVLLLGRPGRRMAVYLVNNLLLFLILLNVFHGPRFSMVLLPCYVLLASHAIIGLGRLIPSRVAARAWMPPLTMLALFAWTAFDSYQFNRKQISEGPWEILTFADWFDRNIDEQYRHGIIAARKPHIAYYLGLEFRMIPDARTHDKLLGELEAMKAEYLYYSYIEEHWRPWLRYLLDFEQKYPGLIPVVSMKTPPAVLYKVAEWPEDAEQDPSGR